MARAPRAPGGELRARRRGRCAGARHHAHHVPGAGPVGGGGQQARRGRQHRHQRDRARAQGWLHAAAQLRSEEHTSELQSPCNLVCRLLLEKKKQISLCTSVLKLPLMPPLTIITLRTAVPVMRSGLTYKPPMHCLLSMFSRLSASMISVYV